MQPFLRVHLTWLDAGDTVYVRQFRSVYNSNRRAIIATLDFIFSLAAFLLLTLAFGKRILVLVAGDDGSPVG